MGVGIFDDGEWIGRCVQGTDEERQGVGCEVDKV